MNQYIKKHKIKYIHEGFDFNQAQFDNEDEVLKLMDPEIFFSADYIKTLIPIDIANNYTCIDGHNCIEIKCNNMTALTIRYTKSNKDIKLYITYYFRGSNIIFSTFNIFKAIYKSSLVLGNFNILEITMELSDYWEIDSFLGCTFTKKDMLYIPELLDKINIKKRVDTPVYFIAEADNEAGLNEVYNFLLSHNKNNQFTVLKGKLTDESISETSVRNARDFFGDEDPVEFLKNNYIYQPDNIKIDKLDNTFVQNAISQLRVKLKFVKYTVKDELIQLAILYKKLGLGFVMPELLLTKQSTQYDKIVSFYFSDYVDGKLVKNMNSHALGNLRIAIEEAMERGISLKMIIAMVLIIDKIPE